MRTITIAGNLRRLSKPISVLIPVAVFLLFTRLAMEPDLSRSIPLLLIICGIIVILLALTQYLAVQWSFSWSVPLIIGIAIFIRLIFIREPPVLSDDLYRYLVDGQAILRGISPYAMAPEAADFLPPDMANLPELVNHSHLITLYPPAAQIVFAAGATMGILIDPLIGMKLVLCIMDICTCMMMITLVRSLDIPACRVILYAWNPLPVMEIAGSGHIDGAAVFFFTAALMLTSRAKTGIFTGVFMALAILTKWIPLMILPAWLLLVPNKKRATALASALLTSGILTALFWPELTNGIATLGQYLRHWEFSGFVFRSLRQLSGSGIIARSIVAALFTGIVGVLFIRHVFFHTSRKNIFAYLAVVSTAFPMLSPTVYPWYALYPAACLSFVQTPAVLILSWSVLLSYRILMVRHTTGLWIEDDLTPLLIIAAPAAAIAIQGIVARFSMRQ